MKKKPEEIFKTPPKEDFKTYFNRMIKKPYIEQERLNDAIKIAKEHGYSVVTKEK